MVKLLIRKDKKMEQLKTNVAIANIKGSNVYPNLHGRVIFKQEDYGVMVTAEIYGLPISTQKCATNIFGFHIHEGGSCTGNQTDPFLNVGGHYNPNNCNHPAHAGDLPPLFGNDGYAYLSVLTNRFTLNEIIGKTIIIHDKPDDFTTQPAGNAGNKIACGEITPL